jgi:purine-binding chemotaxis protein CheW
LKNVIVFSIASHPYAVELRWIREVFNFGHVTPMPLAPLAFVGLVNFHGSILPIIDVTGLEGRNPSQARQGECGLLLEVDHQQAALRAHAVDEVSSLASGESESRLIDSRGREVLLLDPPQLFARAASLRGAL